jgi:hypothetical protein
MNENEKVDVVLKSVRLAGLSKGTRYKIYVDDKLVKEGIVE